MRPRGLRRIRIGHQEHGRTRHPERTVWERRWERTSPPLCGLDEIRRWKPPGKGSYPCRHMERKARHGLPARAEGGPLPGLRGLRADFLSALEALGCPEGPGAQAGMTGRVPNLRLLRRPRGFEGFVPSPEDLTPCDQALCEPDHLPGGHFERDAAAPTACGEHNRKEHAVIIQVRQLLDLGASASRSPRFRASIALRASSTFSSDIAYSDKPAASRASSRSI